MDEKAQKLAEYEQRVAEAMKKVEGRTRGGLEDYLSYDDLLRYTMGVLQASNYHGMIKQYRDHGMFVIRVEHYREAVRLWVILDQAQITGYRTSKMWRQGCKVRISFIRKRDGKRVYY